MVYRVSVPDELRDEELFMDDLPDNDDLGYRDKLPSVDDPVPIEEARREPKPKKLDAGVKLL